MKDNNIKHRGRNIPWKQVVSFHKEIAARAENSFFSLNVRDATADRWTSIKNFEPFNLEGSWKIRTDQIVSNQFLQNIMQGTHETIFIGGPCYLGWSRNFKNDWIPQWRPIMYREVSIRIDGDKIEVLPNKGYWYLTPILGDLLDKCQLSIGKDLDEFGREILEKAEKTQVNDSRPLSSIILEILINNIPEVESDLTKKANLNTMPTPWVLFAPTSRFSALTRYLMADYVKLEKILENQIDTIGGLDVLDDNTKHEEIINPELLPLIPLNRTQKLAVESILSNKPLTVISGPPGCGKSQVVVASLLNAWASGMTVLFASNNNPAVDVVRERLEKFESQFPIAVRDGNRKKNNVIELLRRVLNYAASSNAVAELKEESNNYRINLINKREKLKDQLEGKLPQQADEGRRTSFKAYAQYQKIKESIEIEQADLKKEWIDIGLNNLSLSNAKEKLKLTGDWIGKIEYYINKQKEDSNTQSSLTAKRENLINERNKITGLLGLEFDKIENWNWLSNGPSASILTAWEEKLLSALSSDQEAHLEFFEWKKEYERWDNADDANETSLKANNFAQNIKQKIAVLIPHIKEIDNRKVKLQESIEQLKINGLDEKPEIDKEVLDNWTSYYSHLLSRKSKWYDFIPWSEKSNILRNLRKLEREIRHYIPLSKWLQIGELNENGRKLFSQVVEILRYYREELDKWIEIGELRKTVDETIEKMRSDAGLLELDNIPSGSDIKEWKIVSEKAKSLSILAKEASIGWQKKKCKENAINRINDLIKSWKCLAAGFPLKESWSDSVGSSFIKAMESLHSSPDLQNLVRLRNEYYVGKFKTLIKLWDKAKEYQKNIDDIQNEISYIPKYEDRIHEWFAQKPKRSLLIIPKSNEWPDIDEATERLQKLSNLCERVDKFVNHEKPARLEEAEGEYIWAIEKLSEAIGILPDSKTKEGLLNIFDKLKNKKNADWPLRDIGKLFQEFSPDIIKSKIEKIDAQLERSSFEEAKAFWLNRLESDEEAVIAVDNLEKIVRRNNGQITDNSIDIFKKSLRIVPIWVTTAQAVKTIPLEPKLFDLVLIDEASQCTLTNLLPLLYRGKRLAIIGDKDQLPAIPTIQESEELILARKFHLEQFLSIIGHTNNDVYSVAADSLPRRRADVIQLNEHFRSNPQIIGFSNQNIYQKALTLKTDPSKGASLPVGSGVHRINERGYAQRGNRGRSWKNLPEAKRVLELIKTLRENEIVRHRSIGVVTPFAAQKETIRDMLSKLNLSGNILVDSAYGFQGDERDIIIFSPVVSRGITPGASRWVEYPPNLVNVALTRARLALFVVADFDYCLKQDSSGILYKLAVYCKNVQILRDTSFAELQLFSWMVVEGWDINIHPIIGDIEVDFTLLSPRGIRLAIEVDGEKYHEGTTTTDKSRDSFLQAQGWKVFRTPARAVLETPHNVITKIKEELELID